MEDARHGDKRSRDRDENDGSGGEYPEPKYSRAHPPQQNLIECVKGNNRELITLAVDRWFQRYLDSPRLATAELLSMLFEACGAKYSIKEELLDDTNVDAVLVSLVDLAKKGEVENYLTWKKEKFENFKANLVFFWDTLIHTCQNGPLFDNFLFDKCMGYIIYLSCTPPRVYRRTATLMGLQLVTSFISIANKLSSHRATSQRQLTAERMKRADGPLVESLNKALSLTHEWITTLEDMMLKILTRMLKQRVRDVLSDIRMSCIQSLGIWFFSYPSLFLQTPYLKYLGWALNDRDAEVRKASLLVLQKLYEMDAYVPSLDLFTEKYSNRMIEMAMDTDMSAAVCAIGLVKQLLRHQLIPNDKLCPLYDLLIDQPQAIRFSVGELLYDHLIAKKISSSPSSLTGLDDSSSEIHIFRMLDVLRMFSTDLNVSFHLIDDVWEYMKAMKDWKCIISMLLNQNPSTGPSNDEDSTNLIRLLFASIKKAVGAKIIPDYRKQYISKAQHEMFENNRKDITVAMMQNYPQLLHKFVAEKAKLSSLVEIITFMKLDLYSHYRQEHSFKAAVQLIKDAFFQHGEKEALSSCIKAITFCVSESQGELKDFSRGKLKDLEDELLDRLTVAVRELKDGNDEYSLLVNLKRLYLLQLFNPVLVESIHDDIASTLHNIRNLNEEVICLLLLNMHMYVTWSLHSIKREAISEASLSSLISKRDTLFEELSFSMNGIEESKNYSSQLAPRVCAILAEAWCFCRKSNFDSGKLERLGYCPDNVFVERFWKLCAGILNTSDAETDKTGEEDVENTDRDVAVIAACKLVTSGVVPKDYLGPEIISKFGMHGPRVTGIIKGFITWLRKKEEDISNIYLETLKRAYQRYATELSSDGEKSRVDECLAECQELAASLSVLYSGGARAKYRCEILKVVREGVEFAFRDVPRQLLFMEVAITPFVTKLSVPDIMDIKQDVQGRLMLFNTREDPSGWLPCFIFLKTLERKCLKNKDVKNDKGGEAVRHRGQPREHPEPVRKRLFDVAGKT